MPKHSDSPARSGATSVVAAILAMLALSGWTAAQQPNHPNATLTINGVDGPPYPIPQAGLQGTLVTLRVASAVPGVKPFAVALGSVAAGTATVSAGIVDIELGATCFAFAFNGFDPGHPLAAISQLGPAGAPSFQITVPYAPNSNLPSGLQGVVLDPTFAAGVRLTAATDLIPGTPSVTGVTPGFGFANLPNAVLIEGQNFQCGATTVLFGTTPSPAVLVLSATRIQAVAPAFAGTVPALVPVTVTQSHGTSVLPNAFLYTAGSVTLNITETFGPASTPDPAFAPRFNAARWNDASAPGQLAGAPLAGSPFASFSGGSLGTRTQIAVAPPANFNLGLYSPFDDATNNLGAGVNPLGGSHIMHLYEAADLGSPRNALELVEWGPFNNLVIQTTYPNYSAWCGQTSITAPIAGSSAVPGLLAVYRANYTLPTVQAPDPANLSASNPSIGGVLVNGSTPYAVGATFTSYYPYPLFSPPFDYIGSGAGAGNLILEQNIEPGSQLANFHRFRATAVTPVRRLIGRPRSTGSQIAAAGGFEVYHLRFTFVGIEASTQSLFFDTGVANPTYTQMLLNPSPASQPAGTTTVFEVEGADALSANNLPSGPTTGFLKLWEGGPPNAIFRPDALVNTANPSAPQLSGHRYFRFRATLRGNNLTNAVPVYDEVITTATF